MCAKAAILATLTDTNASESLKNDARRTHTSSAHRIAPSFIYICLTFK